MNVTPTSGPIASSSTHHAREATSSRYSFRSSQRKADAKAAKGAKKNSWLFFACFALFALNDCSGERKEYFFEVVARAAAPRSGHRGELLQRAFTARAAATQQHEPIADARGVANLVNRQEHRPPSRGVRAQRLRDVAALAEVETLERLVGEQQWLRHQQPDREQRALALSLRQAADSGVERRADVEAADHFVAHAGAAAEKAERVVDRPSHRLRRPWNDLIGQIEQRRGALAAANRLAVADQRSLVERQHAAHALEQRRLSRSVRPDQAEHFALPDRKCDVVERREAAVTLSEMPDLQQASTCNRQRRLTTTSRRSCEVVRIPSTRLQARRLATACS